MIETLLTEKFVTVNASAQDWEQAIRLAGDLLLKNDCIEPGYTDSIIAAIKEIGPYIVIGPGIALAHARPEDGVKKISLSMVTLDPPVNFGDEDNDPVRLVIGMGAVDNNSHIDVIKDMTGFLGDETFMDKLYAAQTPEELVDLIHSRYKSEKKAS